MQKVYIVMRNADQTEGRGPMYPTGYGFTSAVVASQLVNPNDYIRDEINEITIFDNLNDFKAWRNADLRERALNKLTREEKAVLGL